jgi:hypothetical protein
VVAAFVHLWHPALPIAAAIALGALIAPPDPVAATATAGKLGLPRRLVVVLGREGLFNDVTAIVIYRSPSTRSAVITVRRWLFGADADLPDRVEDFAVGQRGVDGDGFRSPIHIDRIHATEAAQRLLGDDGGLVGVVGHVEGVGHEVAISGSTGFKRFRSMFDS